MIPLTKTILSINMDRVQIHLLIFFIIWEIGIRYESLLSYLSLLIIFKAILFSMHGCLLCIIRVLYVLPKDYRRECWVPRNGHYRVGIGFMCAGNWTPALWKSSQSSKSLNHLFISTKYKSISLPSFVFSEYIFIWCYLLYRNLIVLVLCSVLNSTLFWSQILLNRVDYVTSSFPFSDTILNSLGSIKRNIFTLYSGKYYKYGLLSLDKLSSVERSAVNTAHSLAYFTTTITQSHQRRNLYHRKNSFPNQSWYTNQLNEATNQNISMTFNHIYSSLMLNVLNILRLTVEHSASWKKNSLY